MHLDELLCSWHKRCFDGKWFWQRDITAFYSSKVCEMIRVTSRRSENKSIVQIDGVLRCEFLEELGKAISVAEPPVTLDLSHLQSVDAESTQVLVKMVKEGAEVTGCSPYIRLLLERHGLELED